MCSKRPPKKYLWPVIHVTELTPENPLYEKSGGGIDMNNDVNRNQVCNYVKSKIVRPCQIIYGCDPTSFAIIEGDASYHILWGMYTTPGYMWDGPVVIMHNQKVDLLGIEYRYETMGQLMDALKMAGLHMNW